LNNPLDLAMIHRQVMSGYRRIGVDSLIGFLARNGDGGEIFAPATGIRCGAIRNSHSFNNPSDHVLI
jgi:hypothetical protein